MYHEPTNETVDEIDKLSDVNTICFILHSKLFDEGQE